MVGNKDMVKGKKDIRILSPFHYPLSLSPSSPPGFNGARHKGERDTYLHGRRTHLPAPAHRGEPEAAAQDPPHSDAQGKRVQQCQVLLGCCSIQQCQVLLGCCSIQQCQVLLGCCSIQQCQVLLGCCSIQQCQVLFGCCSIQQCQVLLGCCSIQQCQVLKTCCSAHWLAPAIYQYNYRII